MEDVPFTAQRHAAQVFVHFCVSDRRCQIPFFFIIMHYITFHTKSAFFFISSFGDVNDLPPPLICCSLNAKR